MFSYYGAKHANASKYQAPQHNTIIEPFAGSAGYACHWLAKDPTKTAILIEKDPRVIDAWQRLLAATPEQIAQWPYPTEGDYVSDQILAGLAGSGSAKPDKCIVTPRMAQNFGALRRRMAWLRGLIGDRITITEGDYQQSPNIEATWFVDPPYQHQGHAYKHGSKGIDYPQLSAWCQTRQGQTIVCEAEPADWLPWNKSYQLVALGGNLTTELIWESNPDPTLFDV